MRTQVTTTWPSLIFNWVCKQSVSSLLRAVSYAHKSITCHVKRKREIFKFLPITIESFSSISNRRKSYERLK